MATKFTDEQKAFIAKHCLGEGRYCGNVVYEFTPVVTDELIADLEAAGIPFERSRADNHEHPDFGKPIVIFTLWMEHDPPLIGCCVCGYMDYQRRAQGVGFNYETRKCHTCEPVTTAVTNT